MRITTKGRYALRAMANLALAEDKKPKAIKTIAAEEQISPEFLEQIFFKLKKASIIESVRGPGGGFMITRNPDQITIKDIFIAVEEGLDLTPCTSCNEDDSFECAKMDTCLVHDVWRNASDHINSYFGGISLEDISKKNRGKMLNTAFDGKTLPQV